MTDRTKKKIESAFVSLRNEWLLWELLKNLNSIASLQALVFDSKGRGRAFEAIEGELIEAVQQPLDNLLLYDLIDPPRPDSKARKENRSKETELCNLETIRNTGISPGST